MKKWIKVGLGIIVGVPLVAYAAGTFMPRDHVARMTMALTSPPDRVWDLVSDVEHAARWRTDITAVRVDPSGRGTAIDGALVPGSLRFTESSAQGDITFVVERQNPPHQQVVRIVDADQPFGGTWTWDLEPAGTGTRLTITENGFVKNPVFRVMGALFFPPTATMEAYLRALAKELGETAEPRDSGSRP